MVVHPTAAQCQRWSFVMLGLGGTPSMTSPWSASASPLATVSTTSLDLWKLVCCFVHLPHPGEDVYGMRLFWGCLGDSGIGEDLCLGWGCSGAVWVPVELEKTCAWDEMNLFGWKKRWSCWENVLLARWKYVRVWEKECTFFSQVKVCIGMRGRMREKELKLENLIKREREGRKKRDSW